MKFLGSDLTNQSDVSAFTSSTTIEEIAVNFGNIPVYNTKKVLTLNGALTTEKVIISASPINDELEMDNIICSAKITNDNELTIFVAAMPGPIVGTYNFNILRG